MSGILETDLSLITDVYTQDHFTLENKNQKGEWLCLEFTAR